jgi:hypothetical protein
LTHIAIWADWLEGGGAFCYKKGTVGVEKRQNQNAIKPGKDAVKIWRKKVAKKRGGA